LDWILLAKDREQWQANENSVMNLTIWCLTLAVVSVQFLLKYQSSAKVSAKNVPTIRHFLEPCGIYTPLQLVCCLNLSKKALL